LNNIETNTSTSIDNIKSKISEIGSEWLKLKEKLESMTIQTPKTIMPDTAFTGEEDYVSSGLTVLADVKKYGGSSSSSSSSSSSGGGTYYFGSSDMSPMEYNKAENKFRNENRDAIADIAKRQNVDMGVATYMYTANKDSGYEQYLSGGMNKSAGLHLLDGTPSRPELILNADDTKNMLSMLSVTRDFVGGAKLSNIETGQTNNSTMSENWNINKIEVKTNDAGQFMRNMKNFARAKK